MSLADDIRIIAKTKELEEKIAKVEKSAGDPAKAAITASRVLTTQSGNTSKTIATGQPPGASDSGVIVTLPTGSASYIPPFSPTSPTSNNNNVANNGGDNKVNSDTANSINRLNLGNDTNLTSHATVGTGLSGSQVTEVLTKGADDSNLNSIIAQMVAAGYSSADIYKFTQSYLADKYPHLGEQTAKDIADNQSSVPQSTFLSPPELHYIGNSLGSEVLSSILAFDSEDDTKSVKVILNGNYPTPNHADALAAGQGDWDDANSPPILSTFASGYYWVIKGGYVGSTIVGQTFSSILSQRESVDGTKAYAIDAPNGGGLVTSLSPSSTDPYILFSSNLSGTIGQSAGTLGGTIYILNSSPPVGTGEFGTEACPGLGSVPCALDPPRETFWPATGVYVLLFGAGIFNGSVYDSEVPVRYTLQNSSVRVKIGNGTSVVDSRYMDIEMGIEGGFLVTTVQSDGTTKVGSNFYDSQGVLRQANISPTSVDYFRPR